MGCVVVVAVLLLSVECTLLLLLSACVDCAIGRAGPPSLVRQGRYGTTRELGLVRGGGVGKFFGVPCLCGQCGGGVKAWLLNQTVVEEARQKLFRPQNATENVLLGLIPLVGTGCNLGLSHAGGTCCDICTAD